MSSISRYAVVEDGVVVNLIEWDGNEDLEAGGLPPVDGQTRILISDGAEPFIGYPATMGATGSWIFGAPPPPPPPSADEILAVNNATRNALLDAANRVVPALQDAVDFGSATANPDLLKAWKQFRVAVNAVDVSQANPVWPPAPQPGYGAALVPETAMA